MSSFVSPDWLKILLTETDLFDLLKDYKLSDIDGNFPCCAGIHSASNIQETWNKIAEIKQNFPDAKLSELVAHYNNIDVLIKAPWLKVWLTEKFISTYGEAIIMDVFNGHKHLIGNIDELYKHIDKPGIGIGIDMHGSANIQLASVNEYANLTGIMFGTLPASSLSFNPSIFDAVMTSEMSIEDIITKQRQLLIQDLHDIITERDDCRQTVKQISDEIKTLYKSTEAQATIAQATIAQATVVIAQANEIAANISIAINLDELEEETELEEEAELEELTPTFSPIQDFDKSMIALYHKLGRSITQLEKSVTDLNITYKTLRCVLYYELSNPQLALPKLDQTVFSGTNPDNSGLGCVVYLKQSPIVTECVRHYLNATNANSNLVFENDSNLVFENDLKHKYKNPRFNVYNPSEAMTYNVWNLFRNFNCGKYPSFVWLFMTHCILTKNGNLPTEAIKVLTMSLFDDCTHNTSDNIISEILRTETTTKIQSGLLYSFLETCGINYDLKLMHCMGKPASDTAANFVKKIKDFFSVHIQEDKWTPFIKRIVEIDFTQNIGSQEGVPSQPDYFYKVDDDITKLSQSSQPLSQGLSQVIQGSQWSQGIHDWSQGSHFGMPSKTGGGNSQDSNPFIYSNPTGGGNSQDSSPFGYPNPTGGDNSQDSNSFSYSTPTGGGNSQDSNSFSYSTPTGGGNSQDSNPLIYITYDDDDAPGSDNEFPLNQLAVVEPIPGATNTRAGKRAGKAGESAVVKSAGKRGGKYNGGRKTTVKFRRIKGRKTTVKSRRIKGRKTTVKSRRIKGRKTRASPSL